MVRGDAVKQARKTLMLDNVPDGSGKTSEEEREKGSGSWGVVLGTLGRQGSMSVLKVSANARGIICIYFANKCRPYNPHYPPRLIPHRPTCYYCQNSRLKSSPSYRNYPYLYKHLVPD